MIIGVFVALLGLLMILPAIADLVAGSDDWVVFAASSGLSIFVGFGLWASGRSSERISLNIRQAFLLTALAWMVLSGFAALPLLWSELDMSFAGAYFEAVSGLTTTGGTVVSGLDNLPPGLLLWRAIMQFYGGIGIIVVAIAVLPMLRIGGMQLFRAESSDRSEKIFPAATQIAGSIVGVYLTLNLACAVAYMLAGMTPFDAMVHAMTTVSTGGFSSHDASLGFFQSAAIDWIAIVFMLAGSLPFVMFIHALRGRPGRFIHSSEVRLYFIIIAAASLTLWVYIETQGHAEGDNGLRHSIFNVVTLITTCGYATVNYTHWGAFAEILLFGVMLVGGCTGSTSGGIKPLRLLLAGKGVAQQMRRMLYPNGVFPLIFDGHTVSDDVIRSVSTFLFTYLATLLGVTLILSANNMDFLTAFSAALANLSNVGPGLGTVVGPAGNYSTLSETALWILSLAMLLGRLEIFTILILLMPRFWRP